MGSGKMLQNLNLVNFDTQFSTSEEIDLLIVAFGYESRSVHLYSKLSKKAKTICCFKFGESATQKQTNDNMSQVDIFDHDIYEAQYHDWDSVREIIVEKIETIRADKERGIIIHIDYSSMPRLWYCNIANYLLSNNRCDDRIYFWYSHGIYPEDFNSKPSAGINEFSLFSGRASIQSSELRTHVVGVGFDSVRTQAILSVLDPSNYVICYAYPHFEPDMKDKILEDNKDVISTSKYSFRLPTDDFVYMLAKLCETTRELAALGEVILVPDGAKPMVLACSLVPLIFNKKTGITCLHVSRHDKYYPPINVKPNGQISGFVITGPAVTGEFC